MDKTLRELWGPAPYIKGPGRSSAHKCGLTDSAQAAEPAVAQERAAAPLAVVRQPLQSTVLDSHLKTREPL